MVRRIGITIGMVLAAALAAAAATYARGVNGEELAASRNCRELLDVSPNLYELCAAYCYSPCNAMDLEEPCPPSDAEILERYNALRRPGDPPMPCVREGCPCFNAEDLRQIGLPLRQIRLPGPNSLAPRCFITEIGGFGEAPLLLEIAPRHFFGATHADANGERPSVCALYAKAPLTVQTVTPGELAVCNDLLLARANELGRMCHALLPSACEVEAIMGSSGICFRNGLDIPVRVELLDLESDRRVVRQLAPRSEELGGAAFVSVPERRASWSAIVEDDVIPLCSGEILFEPRPSGVQTIDQVWIGPDSGCELEP